MRNLLIVNTAVFVTIAVFHVLRIIYQAPAIIGPVNVPMWLSALAVVGSVALAALNWNQIESRDRVQWFKLLLALLIIDATMLLYSWATKLSYWGISGDTFLWFVIIDLVLIGILLLHIPKHSHT
jgi:hypothetical protein